MPRHIASQDDDTFRIQPVDTGQDDGLKNPRQNAATGASAAGVRAVRYLCTNADYGEVNLIPHQYATHSFLLSSSCKGFLSHTSRLHGLRQSYQSGNEMVLMAKYDAWSAR